MEGLLGMEQEEDLKNFINSLEQNVFNSLRALRSLICYLTTSPIITVLS